MSKFNIFSYLSYATDGIVRGNSLPLRMSIYFGIFFGTKRPPSGAKPFKKTSLNEKVFFVFLVLIYSILSISIEFGYYLGKT